MNIKTRNINEHCWVMNDNQPMECIVQGIKIDMLFGYGEKQNPSFQTKKQLLTDSFVLETGVKYILEKAKYPQSDFIEIIQARCFDSKKALLDSFLIEK